MAAFVGRVRELAALEAVAEAAAGDGGAAAVVLGGPGGGESRLLARVAARAKACNRFRGGGGAPERVAGRARRRSGSRSASCSRASDWLRSSWGRSRVRKRSRS